MTKDQLKDEVGPIAMHVVVVLLIEASLLIIGFATQLLEKAIPAQHDHLAIIERLDAWTALALLVIFASYTIALVAIRLWRSLLREITTDVKRGTEVPPR